MRQAEPNLTSTVEGIDASGASLVAAQAEETQARTAMGTALAEAERTVRIEAYDIAATSQRDAVRGQVADAEARLATAEANPDSAGTRHGPEGDGNPATVGPKAQTGKARHDLGPATVRASHLGVVPNAGPSEGQFVAAGNPALTLTDADGGRVTVVLREARQQDVDQGNPAHLLLDAARGRIFEGRVHSGFRGIAIPGGAHGAAAP